MATSGSFLLAANEVRSATRIACGVLFHAELPGAAQFYSAEPRRTIGKQSPCDLGHLRLCPHSLPPGTWFGDFGMWPGVCCPGLLVRGYCEALRSALGCRSFYGDG